MARFFIDGLSIPVGSTGVEGGRKTPDELDDGRLEEGRAPEPAPELEDGLDVDTT